MKIHCIGIGGIAISALANIYQQKGHKVQGSDAESSEITAELKKQGIRVFIGHKASNIAKNIDLVVYSEAVPRSNPELKEARQLKIRCLSGAEALAELSRDHFTIAVSGMHGKSTTASMIAGILIEAGLDPTFVIGTKPGWRVGKSKYLVIEADDYQAKFLHYHPDILILTNIDEEHLDCLKDLNNIMKIFRQYVSQVKGRIIANKDNANIVKLLKNDKKTVFFSLTQKKDVNLLKNILRVPGEHNVSNALAALNAARLLGVSDKIALEALGVYKGVWRRFEEGRAAIGNLSFTIISDYAHHPTEIAATLQALAEKYPERKKWIVFQPHQYQRTFYLFDKFVKVFRQAQSKFGIEKLIITDIYTVEGRESQAIKNKISSQRLVEAIAKAWALYLPRNEITDYLKTNLKTKEIVVIMGAGSIYKLSDNLQARQTARTGFPQKKLTKSERKGKME
ncbi:MAG: UDP-N-acetylmuramate--L-alanine ligase [Candidatus Pacebacteria bacterium]|nr:UDP-N-acetylmuramate--L-alanine ligase [Candidatus Paceibacterota bacterium]